MPFYYFINQSNDLYVPVKLKQCSFEIDSVTFKNDKDLHRLNKYSTTGLTSVED